VASDLHTAGVGNLSYFSLPVWSSYRSCYPPFSVFCYIVRGGDVLRYTPIVGTKVAITAILLVVFQVILAAVFSTVYSGYNFGRPAFTGVLSSSKVVVGREYLRNSGYVYRYGRSPAPNNTCAVPTRSVDVVASHA